jgi:hypothetical protein
METTPEEGTLDHNLENIIQQITFFKRPVKRYNKDYMSTSMSFPSWMKIVKKEVAIYLF